MKVWLDVFTEYKNADNIYKFYNSMRYVLFGIKGEILIIVLGKRIDFFKKVNSLVLKYENHEPKFSRVRSLLNFIVCFHYIFYLPTIKLLV